MMRHGGLTFVAKKNERVRCMTAGSNHINTSFFELENHTFIYNCKVAIPISVNKYPLNKRSWTPQ